MSKQHGHSRVPPGVELGTGVVLGEHVVLYPGTRLGDGVRVFDHAVLGRPPVRAGITTRVLAESLTPLVVGSGSVLGAHCVLYAGSELGREVLVGDLASLREGCRVADSVVLGRGVQLMYDVVVGERTRVIDGAILTGGMLVESDVFIGPGVLSVNDNEVYLKRFGLAAFSVTGPTIRRFAVVGTGANLAAGVVVGTGAIVAPSAMVTRDVPAWSVVAGVPARVVREVAACDRQAILAHFGLPDTHQAA